MHGASVGAAPAGFPFRAAIRQDSAVPEQTIAVNRRARHEFSIDETSRPASP